MLLIALVLGFLLMVVVATLLCACALSGRIDRAEAKTCNTLVGGAQTDPTTFQN